LFSAIHFCIACVINPQHACVWGL